MVDPIPLRVRAGSTNALRTVVYVACGLVVGVVIGYAIVAAFGYGRVVTAILIGLVLAITIIVALRASFSIVLDESRIVVRKLLHKRVLLWNQVERITAAAVVDDKGRRELWSFALTSAVDGHKQSDVLVVIPPVDAQYRNAYEFNKRQQIMDIVALAKMKNVPLYVPTRISFALQKNWHIDSTDS